MNQTKATFYLDSDLYKAFKVKAALSDKKLSELMNETLRNQVAEDKEDVKAVRARAGSPVETYKEFLRNLQADGLI